MTSRADVLDNSCWVGSPTRLGEVKWTVPARSTVPVQVPAQVLKALKLRYPHECRQENRAMLLPSALPAEVECSAVFPLPW